jgi:hypothetical protein
MGALAADARALGSDIPTLTWSRALTPSAYHGRGLIIGILGFLWLNFVGTQVWLLSQTGHGARLVAVVPLSIAVLGLTFGLWRGIRWVRWAAIVLFALWAVRVIIWAWSNWPAVQHQGMTHLQFIAVMATAFIYALSAGLIWRSAAVAAFGAEQRARAGGLSVTARAEAARRVYPPAPVWRRVLVIVGYSTVGLIGCSLAILVLQSPACIDLRRCTSADDAGGLAVASAWVASQIAWIVLGWQSRLPGTRVKCRNPGTDAA